MKKNLLIITWILLLNSLSAVAGVKEVGNGGDVYALQFIAMAEKALLYLQNSESPDVNLTDLSAAIEATKVESTIQVLILQGVKKDALNFPGERRIIFNSQRWASMVTEEKLALVLHEYLGILRIEDASYKISKKLLSEVKSFALTQRGSDSTWLLCHSDSLVVNAFEHRVDYDKRATNFTLLFGGYVLEGHIIDDLAGPVVLTDKNGKSKFSGNTEIDLISNTMFLQGSLNLNGHIIQVETTLKCEEKSGR